MCTQLKVNGYKVTGVPALANVVGGRGIVWHLGVDLDDVPELINREACLCPVDLDATAKKNGFVCDVPDGLGNCTVWTSRTPEPKAKKGEGRVRAKA